MSASVSGVLDVVEAAYRVELDESAWLDGIAAAARAQLDDGLGLCAFTFHFRDGTAPRIRNARMRWMPAGLAELYPSVFNGLDERVKVLPFLKGPCTTASQMTGTRPTRAQGALTAERVRQFGIEDTLWITAAEPSGYGVGLHAGRTRLARAPRSTVALWARLGAHLSAGMRLRERRQQGLAGESALFTPSGRLEHIFEPTEQPALERLRDAVIATTALRATEDPALQLAALGQRPGLVDAQWSLIDRFDHDGKHFVVACVNGPAPPPRAQLTLRERQIVGYAALGHDNKVIAYDLGISHSTVRVLMARAAAKLGVRTRSELVAQYTRLAPTGHGETSDVQTAGPL